MDDIIISFFGVDNQISRGFVFGIVDVNIMILGYYSGFSINRLLKILSNGYIAGIIGAGIAGMSCALRLPDNLSVNCRGVIYCEGTSASTSKYDNG